MFKINKTWLITLVTVAVVFKWLTYSANLTSDTNRVCIAFMITLGNAREFSALNTLLKALWHKDNIYILHLDAKAPMKDRASLQKLIQKHGKNNIQLLDNSILISWGRFSMLLTALHGISSAIALSSEWDYWINLSTADMPLLSPDEIQEVLAVFMEKNHTSFIGGRLPDWKALKTDRRTTYMDDEGLFLEPNREVLSLLATEPQPFKEVVRSKPDIFEVYKGEYWVILHRSLAEYIHHSPDNVARSLYLYLAASYISDELFFQTLMCHPQLPNTFNIIHDHLRFIKWAPNSHGHPSIIDDKLLDQAIQSGAIFARKFVHSKKSSTLLKLHDWVNDSKRRNDRMQGTLLRIQNNEHPTCE